MHVTLIDFHVSGFADNRFTSESARARACGPFSFVHWMLILFIPCDFDSSNQIKTLFQMRSVFAGSPKKKPFVSDWFCENQNTTNSPSLFLSHIVRYLDFSGLAIPIFRTISLKTSAPVHAFPICFFCFYWKFDDWNDWINRISQIGSKTVAEVEFCVTLCRNVDVGILVMA